MSDHLLHIDSIGQDGARFRLECIHPKTPRWHGGGTDGGDADDLSKECNLMSWFDNLGVELFFEDQDVTLPPIRVHADGWGEETPVLEVVAPGETE